MTKFTRGLLAAVSVATVAHGVPANVVDPQQRQRVLHSVECGGSHDPRSELRKPVHTGCRDAGQGQTQPPDRPEA